MLLFSLAMVFVPVVVVVLVVVVDCDDKGNASPRSCSSKTAGKGHGEL